MRKPDAGATSVPFPRVPRPKSTSGPCGTSSAEPSQDAGRVTSQRAALLTTAAEFRFVSAERVQVVFLMQSALNGGEADDGVVRAKQDRLPQLMAPAAERTGSAFVELDLQFRVEQGLE